MPSSGDQNSLDSKRPLSARARLLLLATATIVLFGPPIAGVVTVVSGGPVGVALALFFAPFLLIGMAWMGAGVVGVRRELAVRREATGKE